MADRPQTKFNVATQILPVNTVGCLSLFQIGGSCKSGVKETTTTTTKTKTKTTTTTTTTTPVKPSNPSKDLRSDKRNHDYYAVGEVWPNSLLENK